MRMAGYYAWHTFINSIRKMFRSTVVVVIVSVAAIGMIFGLSAGLIGAIAESKSGTDTEYVSETDSETALLEFGDDTEAIGDNEDNEDNGEFVIGGTAVSESSFIASCFEFGIPVAFIAVLLLGVYTGSKSGSDIFLMADVNFLFTAPIKPQSVLMFRLIFQMAATIVGSVYLVFQIPNLRNLGLGWMAITAIFVAWIFLLLYQKLVSVLSYTLTATHERLRSYVYPFIGVILALVLGIIGISYLNNGRDIVSTLLGTFGAKSTRWIPLIGWYKGMIMAAVENDLSGCLVYMGFLIGLMGVLVYGIWQIKADFYEDALSGAATRENMLAAAKEGRKQATKERSDRIRRNEAMKGWGGTIFFWKEMYNRKRFARFGVLTNTMLIYLGVAAAVALFSVKLAGEPFFPLLAGLLAGGVFFRNYGNPIAAETAMNWLFLVPDNAYCKVFSAMAAGSVSCALDLIPAFVLGVIFMPEKPLAVVLWYGMIVTMDFMLSTVGMMLEVIFPSAALDMVKSMLQLVCKFAMIGIIVVIIAVGAVVWNLSAGLFLEILFNLILGGTLFVIYPAILHDGV